MGIAGTPTGDRTRRALGEGLELRQAQPADVEAIVALQIEAFGAGDGIDVRHRLTRHGANVDDWSVVTDGETIVSSCVLLDVPMRLDGLAVPAGQVEYVATTPAYQRRGLVRAQFELHHERSATRGHVVQFVGGIPYVYRRFGYGYGVSHPELQLIARDRFEAGRVIDASVRLRPATEADLPTMALLDRARSIEGLTAARDDRFWRALVERSTPSTDASGATSEPTEHIVIIERDGAAVAWASLGASEDEHKVWLDPIESSDDAVIDAALAFGLELAGESMRFVALAPPATHYGDRVRTLGTPFPYGQGVFVRIADPVAFLEAIRPVLDTRLGAPGSGFADATGEVAISLYTTSVVLAYERGRITEVRAAPGVEDPWDDDGCGVAPDWFPALALGRWGARELADRVDDVFLGDEADLLEVLFPRLRTDIVTDL